jgi:hypothetical protein
VKLQPASPNAVSLNYATSDGTGVAGSDYTAASGPLSLAAGETSQTFTVNVTGDTLKENSEYFYVTLSGLVGGDMVDNQAFALIVDDDFQPTMTISDATVTEGNSGTVNAVFTATLSNASSNTVTVNYGTSDGSALAVSDYAATTSSLTFNPGQTTKTINVAVSGDTAIEGDEYFYVNLSGAVNATAPDAQALGWVLNDDLTPSVTVSAPAINEGNSGSSNQVFTFNLSPSSPNTVTVNYSTSDGSATAGSDYTAASGVVTFNPGDTSKTVPVSVLGDATAEGNDYYSMNLSAPSGARVVNTPAYAYIVNDDGGATAPTSFLASSSATVTEGNTGTVNATFTVTLTPAASGPVFVNYSTSDSTTIAGLDYVSQVGTLNFAAGQTSKTVTVAVNGDTLDEADEQYYLNLASPVGATIANATGVGTILDDDITPRMSINDATVIEGDTGTVTAAFTVTLSSASAQPVLVDWTTQNNTAVGGADYGSDADTLTFTPGQTSKTINVIVNSDTLIENNETYDVGLSSVGGAVLSDNDGVGTILDVDTFSITGSVFDGAGAGISGVLVTRTGNNLPAVSVTTPANGSFLLPNAPDGNYTVTPTKSGVTFFPDHVNVTVKGATVAIAAFVGGTGNFIEGNIVKGGKGLAGVTVTRTGGGQPTTNVTTNASGYYVISGNPDGNYTITPTKSSTTFAPVSRAVAVAGAPNTGNDFTGS